MQEDSTDQQSFSRFFPSIEKLIKLYAVLLFGVAILYSVIVISKPLISLIDAKAKFWEFQAQGMKSIPDYEIRLQSLRKQLDLLTTENIESRLESIERGIKVGSINTEQIAQLQDLINEFGILKKYMFDDPRKLVELKELQINYAKLESHQNSLATREYVDKETGYNFKVFGVAMTVVGLLLAVLLGVGIYNRPVRTMPLTKGEGTE